MDPAGVRFQQLQPSKTCGQKRPVEVKAIPEINHRPHSTLIVTNYTMQRTQCNEIVRILNGRKPVHTFYTIYKYMRHIYGNVYFVTCKLQTGNCAISHISRIQYFGERKLSFNCKGT